MASAVVGLSIPDRPGCLLGILTDGDLRRALQDHGAETWTQLTAKDLMTADHH